MAEETFFVRMRLNRMARRLKKGSLKARKSTVAALVEASQPRAFALLVEALGDANEYVRRDAITALANKNDIRAVIPIAEMLNDRDRFAANTAVRALAQLGGPQAVEFLIAKLPERRIQEALIESLGALGDTRASVPLAALLDRTKYVYVNQSDMKRPDQLRNKYVLDQFTAVLLTAFFKSCGDMRAAEYELQAMILGLNGSGFSFGLQSYNKGMAKRRKAIAEALGKVGDRRANDALVRALCDQDAEVRKAAAKTLSGLGEPEWQQRIVGLQQEDFRALGKSQDRRIPNAMLEYLDSEDSDLCANAILALGDFKDERVVPRLAKLLESSDYRIKSAVIEALAEFSDAVAAPLLLKVFRENEHFRKEASASLIRMKSKIAIASLVAELANTNRTIRSCAATTLGELGDASAIKPLIAALEDKERNIESEVANALGKFKDITTVEPMIRVFTLRGNVHMADTLMQMLDSLAPTMSEEDERALDRIGSGEAGNLLINELKSKSKYDMRKAMALLVRLKMKRATEPLIECLGDADADVRNDAVKALEKLGEPEWSKVITGNDEDFRRLFKCSDKRVTPALHYAIRELKFALRQTSGRSGNWADRKKVAANLIEIARMCPELYTFDAGTIEYVQEKHTDYYTDRSSDCSGDGHTDKGIGIDFKKFESLSVRYDD